MTGIDLDLAGIRARAEAATPGPWRTSDEFTRAGAGRFFGPEGKSIVGMATGYYGIRALDDAAHIASADPPTVIAMCDLIERQAGEIAQLKAVVDRAQIPVASLRDDLALRMSAVVAEIAVENGTAPRLQRRASVMGEARNRKTDLHNKLVGPIVASIVKPVVAEGGSAVDIMILTESVLVGVAAVCIKLGGDNKVLDVMVDAARQRLAEMRLGDLPTEGGHG